MKKPLLFVVFIYLSANYIFAQCNSTPPPPLTFINPSFEGPPCAGCQPSPWVNCGGTPDTEPGEWGLTQAPSNGSSYVSFLQDGSSASGYYEGSSQQLSSCMVAGQTYVFSVDLAYSAIYNTAGPGNCYSSMEILGSSGLCTESQVLWQSGPITDPNWHTYTVSLTPTSNWCYVTFRPYWITSCSGYVNIMMDNLGPLQAPGPTVSATVNSSISCSQDITGTNTCPADSIILSGLFTGSPVHAVLLTDSTWQKSVVYPLGTASAQKITVHTYLQTGVALYDTIRFNLVDVTTKFGVTSVCAGNVTSFTDSSTVSSGTIIGWTWDFGDGSPISTTHNPNHTYASPGTYIAGLLVNTSSGCTDTVTKQVHVYYRPVTSFTHTDVCLGDTTHFANTSSIDQSTSINGYLWVFGDGSPNSTTGNPSHVYSASGTYNVKLVTTSANGCSDSVSNAVKVYAAPTSAFIAGNTCLFDSATFTNTSINPPGGTIGSWSWNFGDGSPLNTTVLNPHHLYSSSGTYQVTLITHTSIVGCADTLKKTVVVFPMPVANFNAIDVCLNQATTFHDTSTVVNDTVNNWSWNFGDGSALNTTQNPSHTYANAGTYSVKLIITTTKGCKDTVTKNVRVHALPHSLFSAANVCKGDSVLFHNLSSIPSTDTIQSYTWNFDDTSPLSSNANPSHLYANTGVYTIHLSVISVFGCIDSTSKKVVVNANPQAVFVANDTVGCEPVCVIFQNTSIIPAGSSGTWLWNFGDGSSTSTVQEAHHCYTNNLVSNLISYTVSLKVTSDSGCVNTLTKNNYITVYPMPVANFAVQPSTVSIVNPVISMINQTIGGDFWNWNFGDTQTDLTQNPAPHTYADTGNYVITLITSTHYGCIDTAYQNITIEPDFMFYIPNAFTPNGDNINDTFIAKGMFIKDYEMSIFDRWGNLIFYSDNINKPWDGKANQGENVAQQDVYVYLIIVTDFKKRKHNYRGIVTLVR
jgi:gliding motility-associated-like protein